MAWNLALLGAASGGKEKYWISSLGYNSQSDYGYSVAVSPTGDVYSTGYSSINSADIVLVKQGSDGQIKWQRALSSSTGSDVAYNVAVDNSGNVYVTGYTNNVSGINGDNIIIAKYNSAGTLQWQRILGGSTNEEAWSIAFDSANNVYIAGWTNSFGPSVENMLLVKLDPADGTPIWTRVLGGSSSDYAYSVAVDSADGIYITGYSSSTGTSGNDLVLAKYNSSGVFQWQKALNSTANDVGRAVATDSSNNVYVAGYTSSTPTSFNGFLVAKYNSSGVIQWQRTVSGNQSSVAQAIATDSLNNVYVFGYTYVTPNGSGDYFIVKYNSAGTIQWQRTLGGLSYDIGFGIAVDSKDNLYVNGYSGSIPGVSSEFLVAKLPSDGSLTGSYILGGATISYAASSLTDQATSFNDFTPSLTSSSQTISSVAGNLTAQVPTFSLNITEGTPSLSWVTAADLPVAQRTVSYSTTLVASVESMSTTVSYQIISGSLPTGITFNASTGVISGTSTATVGNVATFTVRATSSKGITADRTFSLPTVMSYKFSNTTVINVAPYTSQYYVIDSSRSVTLNSSITNCALVMVGGGASGTYVSNGTSTSGGAGGTVYTNSGFTLSAQTYSLTVGEGGGISFGSSNPGQTTSAFGWSAAGGSGTTGGAGPAGSNAGASIMTVVAPYVFDSSTLSQYAGLSTGYLGGWGAGGTSGNTPFQGGLGGGGNGISCGQNPTSGAYLSGGGGGGGGSASGCGNSSVGSNGGRGLIVIRVPNQ